MRTRVHVSLSSVAVLTASLALAPACRPGQPIVDLSPHDKQARGTIGGILQGAGGGSPLVGRHVYAVATGTGQRLEATTNVTGGFSIEVPPGDYRLEVELREGEAVVKSPGTIHINKSDLDANIIVEVGQR
jgi:Carboxypeptidase regulatory-like domain